MAVNKQAPIHPAELVKEEWITPNQLTVTDAAVLLGVHRQTLTQLLQHHNGISPEMAVRLSRVCATPARVWLERQAVYDLAQVDPKSVKMPIRSATKLAKAAAKARAAR